VLHLADDKRVMDVVAGEGKDPDGDDHAPVKKTKRILPHIERGDGPEFLLGVTGVGE
jgi:hypothetical protein